MSNLTKFEFNTLNITDNNYLTWILDVEIYLNIMGLGDIIKDRNVKNGQEKVKAILSSSPS